MTKTPRSLVKNSAVRRPCVVLPKVRPSPPRRAGGRLPSQSGMPLTPVALAASSASSTFVERHWGAARAMPMWPLIDREAESEAPRAATVERRKERELPDAVEQVGCDGLGHGGSSAR